MMDEVTIYASKAATKNGFVEGTDEYDAFIAEYLQEWSSLQIATPDATSYDLKNRCESLSLRYYKNKKRRLFFDVVLPLIVVAAIFIGIPLLVCVVFDGIFGVAVFLWALLFAVGVLLGWIKD